MSGQEGGDGVAGRGGTRRTVLIAGASNVFVGVIKLAAGILAGSSAMLAEAAHSAADTLNQAFLLASLRRGERPADRRHPFGYGQERYFWSLLAAFGIFIAGAGFSFFEGILALGRKGGGNPLIAYVVLAVAAGSEGASFVRALRQMRGEARNNNLRTLDHVRNSPDTTVKTALFEDSAAVIGLALAALGLVLRQLTGSPVWDGAASISIGALLVVVALRLGLDSRDFLIGRAADQNEIGVIKSEIRETPGIDALLDLRTMHLGPDHLIVAARVAFSDDMSADGAENAADDIDRRLSDRLPLVVHVFLDPTQASSRARPYPRAGPGSRAKLKISRLMHTWRYPEGQSWRAHDCVLNGDNPPKGINSGDRFSGRLHDREDIFPGVNNSSYTHTKYSPGKMFTQKPG